MLSGHMHGKTGFFQTCMYLQDTLYLREEGVRRIFVHWEGQRTEFWVSLNDTVICFVKVLVAIFNIQYSSAPCAVHTRTCCPMQHYTYNKTLGH